jgi:hypothetical protein
MLRFTRAFGALVVTVLVAAGLAVGVSSPGHARALDVCDVTGALNGTGVVGSPLDADLPDWDLGVLSSNVSWLRGGTPFRSGGTTYTPVDSDAGQVIQVQQAVTLLGALACTWTSNAVPITSVVDPGDPDPADPDPGDELLALLGGLGLPPTAEVGQLVSLTAPVWSLPGVTTTYQWMRDGVPIPGADGQSYVPTLEDAGHALTVEVTGALAGIPGLTVVTDALGIPLATTAQLNPTGDVTVQGTRKIGTALSMIGPTWDEDGVSNKYQWLRDDAPIAGATKSTYLLAAEDFGHAVSVKVTGHKEGFTDNTISSDPVQTVLGDAIRFVTKPGVTGTGKVGRLLTVDPGTWTGGTENAVPPAFAYQWRRNDRAIPGAVAQTYQVTRDDVGSRLSVTVTAVRVGYRPGTFRTAEVQVAKLTAKLTGKLVRKGSALQLVLRVPGLTGPTGAVKILDGAKVVKRSSFTKARKGTLVVALGKLKPGVHKLRAVYAGTTTVAGATSKVVKLKVPKRK